MLRGIFNDMVKSVTIELPERDRSLGDDGSGTGSIVEKGKLTEGLARLISFQIGRFR